jgi:PAS domain S-box-containing protein
MLGAGGRVESVLTTVRDVTERRQREALLREREEFFRLVFERGPLAVCIISTDGRILRVNARLCEMLGHSADELAARAFDDLGHPEDRELERPLQGRLEAGDLDHYDLEKRLLTRLGVPIWVRQSRSAVKDEAGELLYGLVMLEDIDARRRAEAERRALELQLRETQKLESLGVLAGGIAHDFNNLLVPVLGNAELLIEDLPHDSRLQAYAKDIVSAAERAAQLARQMLAYSGKGRFVLESTSLGTLVSSMRDLLRAQVGTACTLDFDLDLELPPIEGDLSQLRQVVLNLVQNAAEALPDGNGTITVRVAPRHATRALLAGTHLSTDLAEGDYVCLEVTDTGVGMDDATRERVFDPFVTSKGPGRGLGLPAVLGSIRGHGGAIRVDSRPGRGTTVTVLFPPLAAPSARPAERAAPGAASGAVAGTILLVEDEDAVRLTAQRTLERMGLVVMSACDGEEALELFERHGEDLACALVDVMMPRVSGDEVCRRMRARLAGLPILVMSGYHAGAITDRLAGVVDAVVQKPFTPAGLQEAVRRALSRAPESAPRT